MRRIPFDIEENYPKLTAQVLCSSGWLRMEYKPMLSEVQTKSANYLRIIAVLKALRERGHINDKEYAKAKKYYWKLTGADIVIAD